ncbi:hypothetical protein OUZ56_011803 [Daphnia magna]|uniref:Uncharacterized protein n=1 Tax=Daphnia magna TaxID=35525 RepID=A0ABQ9Z163_9CRUS|nr:hypothetical protein OUZ56_011803 [Daphnia magna]
MTPLLLVKLNNGKDSSPEPSVVILARAQFLLNLRPNCRGLEGHGIEVGKRRAMSDRSMKVSGVREK